MQCSYSVVTHDYISITTVITVPLQLQCEVEKPLLTFRDNFKKELKKYDHHIIDLRKQLASRYAGVEKVWTILNQSIL